MKLLQQVYVPQETVNDIHYKFVKAYVKEGSYTEKESMLIDLETSKSIFTLHSPCSGYVHYLNKENDQIEIGVTIIEIYDSYDEEILKPKNICVNDTVDSDPVFSEAAIKLMETSNLNVEIFKKHEYVTRDIVQKELELKYGKS